ncbi:MAG: type II toxin-antitoxin system HicA family toxin [Geminicoccaceae bacterium]
MERVLQGRGFARVRQKGSHVFYRHADGRTTTVHITRAATSPYHWSARSSPTSGSRRPSSCAF